MHGVSQGSNGDRSRGLPAGLDAALAEGRHRVAELRALVRSRPVSRAALGALVKPLASEPSVISNIEARVQVAMTRAAAEAVIREHAVSLRPLLQALVHEDQPLMSDRRRLADWHTEVRGAKVALELIG